MIHTSKKFICVISLLLAVFLLFSPVFSTNEAYALSKKDKILYIVENQEDIDDILAFAGNNSLGGAFDLRLMKELDGIDLSGYSAVALPYNEELNYDGIKAAHNDGVLIYLYGNLTISDYKKAVGIDDFSLEIELQNAASSASSKVTQYFEKEYEENEAFNIIKFGVKSFLNKIHCEEISAAAYFQIIFENCEKWFSIKLNSSVIKSEFNFSSSWTWDFDETGLKYIPYIWIIRFTGISTNKNRHTIILP